MKREAWLCLMFVSLLSMIFFPIASSDAEGGLLPSLNETVGVAMPSLGEALQRYPDEEAEGEDGGITELYRNVSEADFEVFSVYLEQQGAELVDYKAENGILTATIQLKDESFFINYDTTKSEILVNYPVGTFDGWVKNAKSHFDAAQKLLTEGKTAEAYVEIYAIPQYMAYGPVENLFRDDASFVKAMAALEQEMKLAPYKEIGNVVTFGTYPQTENGTDQTPIEWVVLDCDEANHKTLLISKYGLDVVPYNSQMYTYAVWKDSKVRSWLNNTFLDKAFNENEKAAILITEVDNSSEQGYRGWRAGGANTQDHIFLLSYAEANLYLGVTREDENNTKARLAPTAYAIAKGAWISDSNKSADGMPLGWWWLRSPGESSKYVGANVTSSGALNNKVINSDKGLVRPAFWLDLESDVFDLE